MPNGVVPYVRPLHFVALATAEQMVEEFPLPQWIRKAERTQLARRERAKRLYEFRQVGVACNWRREPVDVIGHDDVTPNLPVGEARPGGTDGRVCVVVCQARLAVRGAAGDEIDDGLVV